ISRRRPQEAATLQPLREQAHALTVMPENLDQPTAAATEHKQMATVRIALERLLHQQRQAIKTLPHVGMAARQPNSRTSRDQDHPRRLLFVSAFISADTVKASTSPLIRIRPPLANSISITPALSGDGAGTVAGSGAIATALNVAGICARSHSCWRQRNNWLV